MKPYYKKSHKAWYANLNHRPVRLGTDEAEARVRFAELVYHEYKVSSLIKLFLTHHATHSAPATHSFYRKPLESFAAFVGQLPAADLKPHHVTKWMDSRPPNGNLARAVKACFRWAVEQSYIKESPLEHLKGSTPASRGDDAYLQPHQWEKVFERAGSMSNLLLVMRETGCRPKEIRCVEARHFDREGRCWVFPKEESKGKCVSRVVHLSDAAHHLVCKLALKYPTGQLFRNAKGNAWTAHTLGDRCRRISTKVGFRFTSYSVRHTFATDAIVRGVDLTTIATLMGHANLKMLNQVYQHVRCRSEHVKESLRRAVG